MKKICWSSGVKVGLEKSKTPGAGLDVGRLELRKTPTSASTAALVSLQSLAFAVAKTATALQRTALAASHGAFDIFRSGSGFASHSFSPVERKT